MSFPLSLVHPLSPTVQSRSQTESSGSRARWRAESSALPQRAQNHPASRAPSSLSTPPHRGSSRSISQPSFSPTRMKAIITGVSNRTNSELLLFLNDAEPSRTALLSRYNDLHGFHDFSGLSVLFTTRPSILCRYGRPSSSSGSGSEKRRQ